MLHLMYYLYSVECIASTRLNGSVFVDNKQYYNVDVCESVALRSYIYQCDFIKCVLVNCVDRIIISLLSHADYRI